MTLPLIDLKAQYKTIKKEIDATILDALTDASFVGGPAVQKFEEDFKSVTSDDGYVISCANGTDSMEMILKAMNIGPGDEVIVPAHTWISTSGVVMSVGAIPIFADIDYESCCIDISAIKSKITTATKAIIAVHLYGHPAPIGEIMEISKIHHLKVIEDCAQAHYTKINDQNVGTFGHAASFSFFPGKNLGCYGDGGAVYTRDKKLQETIRMLSNHGQLKKHEHLIHGRNSRLDTLQAKILSVKLPYLETWIEKKNQHAAYYNQHLNSIPELTLPPKVASSNRHSWHLYVVKTKKRDALAEFLKSKNVQTGIHYPLALPFQPCYQYKNHKHSDFPVAARLQDEVLSLPMYAELTQEQLQYCAAMIKEFFKV